VNVIVLVLLFLMYTLVFKSLGSQRLHLFDPKYNKNCIIVKYWDV